MNDFNEDLGNVLIVTPGSPQSALFIEYVSEKTGCSVTGLEPGSPRIAQTLRDYNLALFDASALDERDIGHVQQAVADGAKTVFSGFNIPSEDEALRLLDLLYLQGIFYKTDQLDLLCKGILCLLNGDFWMSRHLMTRLVRLYRQQRTNTYRPACGLTQRELEILAMLGSGETNMNIAKQLFISEHTVKSHLYNIFRKIEVKNRTQAINWAKDHLGAPPPQVMWRRRRAEARAI
ncbi:LuxR C-terminal-related transcriptional regulator [Thioalkalivibrio thiocyanoxidans]|uniref:LuxR C-terminal-related transcriptional regulator n=1 Tax=Thioalkalivibrio thiocyanoxidans TaxID=152475 RepID=UPI0003A4E722|nr:LuxR C-terminal-related transcriptional regulator [Thioalkalivibrio thiocyanoxidans]